MTGAILHVKICLPIILWENKLSCAFTLFTPTTFEDIKLNVKGLYFSYPHIISTLMYKFNLSNNHLTGEFPIDLENLKGLKPLNL